MPKINKFKVKNSDKCYFVKGLDKDQKKKPNRKNIKEKDNVNYKISIVQSIMMDLLSEWSADAVWSEIYVHFLQRKVSLGAFRKGCLSFLSFKLIHSCKVCFSSVKEIIVTDSSQKQSAHKKKIFILNHFSDHFEDAR